MKKPESYNNLEPIAVAYYFTERTVENHEISLDFHVIYARHISDGYLYLHCLDLDLIAHAKTEPELRLMEMIQGQIAIYSEEKRLEFLTESPVDDDLMAFHHYLKRIHYQSEGKKLDSYLKDKSGYIFEKKRRLVTQKIEEDLILVEKKQEWRIAM